MCKLLVSVALVFFAASPAFAFWRACHRFPTARLPDHIDTPMCNEERCFATRGEDFIANVTMSSPESHVELLSANTVFIGGIGIPLPMDPPHDNGCNNLFINGIQQFCPTQPNRQYTWIIYQPIADIVPPFNNAIVEYTITDRGRLVGCVEFTATVI